MRAVASCCCMLSPFIRCNRVAVSTSLWEWNIGIFRNSTMTTLVADLLQQSFWSSTWYEWDDESQERTRMHERFRRYPFGYFLFNYFLLFRAFSHFVAWGANKIIASQKQIGRVSAMCAGLVYYNLQMCLGSAGELRCACHFVSVHVLTAACNSVVTCVVCAADSWVRLQGGVSSHCLWNHQQLKGEL